MANLIYIIGKSATGKDTIYQNLKQKLNVNSYVTYTTRPKRKLEQQGREYNFITKEQFKKLQEQGKIMEYRNYNVINQEGKSDIWTYATVDDNQWNTSGDFLSIRNTGIIQCSIKIHKSQPTKVNKHYSNLYKYRWKRKKKKGNRKRKYTG